MSSSSSVLEELLVSLLLDWLCRLACFDLAVTNHLQREKGTLASPASDITLVPLFSGSGDVYPFEDEPNAAVVAALVPGCVGVGSRMLGLGIAWYRFDYRSDGHLIREKQVAGCSRSIRCSSW